MTFLQFVITLIFSYYLILIISNLLGEFRGPEKLTIWELLVQENTYFSEQHKTAKLYTHVSLVCPSKAL